MNLFVSILLLTQRDSRLIPKQHPLPKTSRMLPARRSSSMKIPTRMFPRRPTLKLTKKKKRPTPQSKIWNLSTSSSSPCLPLNHREQRRPHLQMNHCSTILQMKTMAKESGSPRPTLISTNPDILTSFRAPKAKERRTKSFMLAA